MYPSLESPSEKCFLVSVGSGTLVKICSW